MTKAKKKATKKSVKISTGNKTVKKKSAVKSKSKSTNKKISKGVSRTKSAKITKLEVYRTTTEAKIPTFGEGLRYPWGRALRLGNILWFMIPAMFVLFIAILLFAGSAFGIPNIPWYFGVISLLFFVPVFLISAFAMFGYLRRIVVSIVNGDRKGLPSFGSFWGNTKVGFLLALKMLPLIVVVNIVNIVPFFGWIVSFLASILLVPYLTMNLLYTDKFEESFAIKKAWDAVFGNFAEYMIAVVKMIGFFLIYSFLILVLVGIPCLQFGQYFFLADFYARHR